MYNALDLYSKVEDLLGVHEVTPNLYRHYIRTLDKLKFDSLLDVGCGRGAFLLKISERYPWVHSLGIDLSPRMIEVTRKKGLEAHHKDICSLNGIKFDIITAVFDMVNYLDNKSLQNFMGCVQEKLKKGGHFLFDINSYYAFNELAVGSFIKDSGDRFVTIDSDFDGLKYRSEFTLFEKREDGAYDKSQETIMQYYHTTKKIMELTNLKLITQQNISVYGDEVEKYYLVFRKEP